MFAYCLHSRPQLAIRKFTLFLKRDGIAEQQRKLVDSVLMEHMTLSESAALMYISPVDIRNLALALQCSAI